jgi:DNA polymerase III subunit beta
MKLTCKQSDLAKGLSTVSHAVSTRSTLPILGTILVAAESDGIRLSATNLEIGITCRIPAETQQEGTAAVPARLLTEFVVTLSATSANGLKISGKSSQATLRGMDPAEFPGVPTAEAGDAPVVVDAAELKAMITHTVFAAATDDARPVFTGVLARVRDDKLTFAAADSFRLAVRGAQLQASGGGVATAVNDILIPAKTLAELARILPDDGSVRITPTLNRNQVLFQADGLDLVSTLIAGQFPNFEAIVPKTHSTTVTLPTEEFRAAAKRAAIFARDSSNIVRLKVEAGQEGGLTPGKVTLEATADENGETSSTLDAAVDGEGLEIIFNVKYLTDVLGVIETPQVSLELSSAQKPGVLKPGNADDYVYVIMPMHTTR